MAIAPRRSPKRPWGALTLLAILIAGLGWILYLRMTDQPMRDPFGIYRPASLNEEAAAMNEPREIQPPADGMVRALISAKPIEAYERVTREDLFNRQMANFAFMDLTEEFAEENGVLLGLSGILGRVMRRPKRPGFAFTERDFLPKGTRPGLSAGIPAGKRALRIDVDLVRGIIGLAPGDRFDLMAAQTVEPPVVVAGPGAANSRARSAGAAPLGVYASLLPRPGEAADGSTLTTPSRTAQAKVDVIVQGGVIVSGLETRLIPTSSAGLTTGLVSGTRPVQEMVIALAPEEVAPLMAALRLKADLTCLARSGRPEDDVESLTPGLVPDFQVEASAKPSDEMMDAKSKRNSGVMPGVMVVEKVVGGVRTLVAVPRAPENEETDPR